MEFDLEGLKQFATVLGIPGLMVAAWYLLERDKGKRAATAAEAAAKLDEKRLEIEAAKVEAMRAGFAALNDKLEEHTRVDLAHHGHVREDLAELRGEITGRTARLSRDEIEPLHVTGEGTPRATRAVVGSVQIPALVAVPRRGPRDDDGGVG